MERQNGFKYMANFSVKNTIDYNKITEMCTKDEILIGYPSGMIHAESGEDLSEIAKKLTYGAGPQTWKTNTTRETGKLTKSGKPQKKRMVETHSVKGIPARPFIEDGMLYGVVEINKSIEDYYKQKMKGMSARNGLLRIAITAIGAIQKFVRGDYYKSISPNSKTTIHAKKSDKPLIDTAQLINSLTFVIKDEVYSKQKNESNGKKYWEIK